MLKPVEDKGAVQRLAPEDWTPPLAFTAAGLRSGATRPPV
jgi:hypothetical protein